MSDLLPTDYCLLFAVRSKQRELEISLQLAVDWSIKFDLELIAQRKLHHAASLGFA